MQPVEAQLRRLARVYMGRERLHDWRLAELWLVRELESGSY